MDAHGEFARRGGILDVFPAGEELPIRIEFIGDTVESIRRFDPGTQRSVETLDRFGLVPVREDVRRATTSAVADSADHEATAKAVALRTSIFDYLRLAHDFRGFVAEPTEVETQVKAAWEQIETSYADAVER